MKRASVDHKRMKELNQQYLFQLIRSQAPISRPQLAALSGLTFPTITSLVADLMEQRFVREQGVASQAAGRKASLLEISPDGLFAIGLIVTETQMTGVVLNLLGQVMYTREWPCNIRGADYAALDRLAEHVTSFLETSPIAREHILGIGCGLSGYIDAKRGICVDSPNMQWRHLTISTPLAERLGIPFFIDNNVRCLTAYEHLFGQGQAFENYAVLVLGTGVGAGLVLEGRLYVGTSGGAGEVGHQCIVEQGRLCTCGKRGCLETYVSDRGIVQTYQELCDDPNLAQTRTLPDIIERAHKGEELALRVFQQTGVWLGQGLACVINLFNPECLLLAYTHNEVHTYLQESLLQTLQGYTFSELGNQLVLLNERINYEKWACGAGSLVLSHMFHDMPAFSVGKELIL